MYACVCVCVCDGHLSCLLVSPSRSCTTRLGRGEGDGGQTRPVATQMKEKAGRKRHQKSVEKHAQRENECANAHIHTGREHKRGWGGHSVTQKRGETQEKVGSAERGGRWQESARRQKVRSKNTKERLRSSKSSLTDLRAGLRRASQAAAFVEGQAKTCHALSGTAVPVLLKEPRRRNLPAPNPPSLRRLASLHVTRASSSMLFKR